MHTILKVKPLKKQILKQISAYFCIFLYTCFVSLYGLYTAFQTAHATEEKIVFLSPDFNRHTLGNYPNNFYFFSEIGETGTPAKGIKTHNVPEGEWVWEKPQILKFIPTGDWKTSVDMNQKYEIDLTSLEMPAHIQLTDKIFTNHYITRGAKIEEGHFFLDSSQNANHAISFAITFTESIDENIRKDIQERTTIHKIKGSNVKIGKQNWTWFADNTRAVVYAPILQLPTNFALLLLTLYDIGIIYDDGTIRNDSACNEVFISLENHE